MKIGIVIVTYNRVNELEKALNLYENQTLEPKYIIVVNNNSTDGTRDFLEKWQMKKKNIEKYIINLDENIGGSGGFYTGLKKSIELDADWVWIADDDAYPELDCLEKSKNFYEKITDIRKSDIGAICAAVINNGTIDISHRKRVVKDKFNIYEIPIEKYEYQKEYFELDLFSYVGSLIKKDVLKKIGLTEKSYFIYYDDTEHSFRISKKFKILCVPKIKINHDIVLQKRELINWKIYYGTRNRLLFYKKHFPKKYYYIMILKNRIMGIKSRNKIYCKMINRAINDSKNNIQGVNKIYKPGWKYK